MSWQRIDHDALHAVARSAGGLDVWWWPQPRACPPSARRLRVDTILRAVLAPYLALAPASLQFAREAHGRPFLVHPGAPDFNLSDTVGGTVVAVAGHGRIGVDVERCDRQPAVQRLAERWFAADEAQCLQTLGDEPARRAFLHLWTAKEAACKATGTGIYGFLSAWRFAVDAAAAPPRLIALPEAAGSRARWHFHRLAPTPVHTVVVACRDLFVPARAFRVETREA